MTRSRLNPKKYELLKTDFETMINYIKMNVGREDMFDILHKEHGNIETILKKYFYIHKNKI